MIACCKGAPDGPQEVFILRGVEADRSCLDEQDCRPRPDGLLIYEGKLSNTFQSGIRAATFYEK